mmetsp:Transcript_21879/g.44806  ORF Transcript_21879/g.44806 Transcript_21879/m.44806 type:complete len:171 (+) Transcript_21879:398-910(+)
MQRVYLDRDLGLRRELPLRPLALRPKPPKRALVPGAIALHLPLEVLKAEVQHPIVEVLAAKVRVPGSGAHLEDRVRDVEDRHIESASSHIEDEDVRLRALFGFSVQAIGDGRRCGLVYDTQHLEARDLARILSSLPLGVSEVGGHRDHGLLHALAQEGLRRRFHLDEHDG